MRTSFYRWMAVASALTCAFAAHLAPGQSCEPGWQSGYGVRGVLGSRQDTIYALASWDDGTGPGLYVAGDLYFAGEAFAGNIARWDGERWSALGDAASAPDGMPGPDRVVYDMAVYDDGTGEALYVAGGFASVDGVPAARIARWDGQRWSDVGGGMGGPGASYVFALEVYDGALYASGRFTNAGGVSASNIARWDGTAWTPLGGGLNERVLTLAVVDDGLNEVLYAGGRFTEASGTPAHRVACWNGSAWQALGEGLPDGLSVSFAAHDEGDGEALYALGNFFVPGYEQRLYRWHDGEWTALPLPERSWLQNLASLNLDGRRTLCVVGQFSSPAHETVARMATWDGASWTLEAPADDYLHPYFARDAIVHDDGSGPALYLGGFFNNVGGVGLSNVARFDGQTWTGVGDQMGVDRQVASLTTWDDGTGRAVYAAGSFLSAGDTLVHRVARLDDQGWSALAGPDGAIGLDAQAYVIEAYDDGDGSELYVGGFFDRAGGQQASKIARWDGTRWAALGDGLDGSPRAMAVHDEGQGDRLFVGGDFGVAGGLPVRCLARWDGQQWSATEGGPNRSVHALASFDHGAGPMLYAGGEFDRVNDDRAWYIARWDGEAWEPLPGLTAGTNRPVNALAEFDDGSGPALYVGGSFDYAGGLPAAGIARWDGTAWSAVGELDLASVTSLEVVPLPGGPRLVAGGWFSFDGGLTSHGTMAWDGLRWQPLDRGVDDPVRSLAWIDLGKGVELVVGGSFLRFDGRPSGYLARLRTCLAACAADVDRDGELTPLDFLAFQHFFDAGDTRADFDIDGTLTIFDFLAFQNAFDAGCG
ncbi:MAG: GC-type dockerin domain-anchored protein [Phycisphaerales bacterium JB060]